MMKAYRNGNIFTGMEILPDHAVLTMEGKILDVVNQSVIPSHARQIDLDNGLLSPAFIDLQIYGGNDYLFGEYPSPQALSATYDYCRSGGAHWFMPTVATNSEEVIFKAIDSIREYWQQGGQGVLGLHLEGPYINPAKRGAHLTEFIQAPTLPGVKKLFDYGQGVLKMMTLAPEVCSAEVLDFLLEMPVILSAGHSNARFVEAREAFNRGIPAATHLFNAMSPLQHREPGLVGAILDDPTVRVSIVADGHHVDFPVIRLSKKILENRMFLITDAVTANPRGQYSHQLQGDKYVLADGTLSGSALTMLQAVKNCVQQVGIPLEEALRMASLYPAQVVKLDQSLGRIAPGYTENFILLDANLNLQLPEINS